MGEFYFGAGGEVFGERVAKKLKDHRLKPGGVAEHQRALLVVEKLKDHRLKPGGVLKDSGRFVALKLKYHRPSLVVF